MSLGSGPQDGARLVDDADVDFGTTRERAATCGASGAENGVSDMLPSTTPDPDVKVKLQRRLRRLSMLLTQAGQVVGSLGDLVEEVLDAGASSRLMERVAEPDKTAPETATDAPVRAPSTALLGVPELAQLLSVDVATVRRWRREKKLPPALVMGTTLRWRPEDIDEWIEANREAPR